MGMGLVIEDERIRNPEEMIVTLHELQGQESYKMESRRQFIAKAGFILFFLGILRLTSSADIPGILDILLLLFLGGLASIIVFFYVEDFNRLMRRFGLGGIIYVLLLSVVIVIIGGNI